MFEKNYVIKITLPEGAKDALIWEYDLTGIKKLTVTADEGICGLLYDSKSKKFVYLGETLKLAHRDYRLFGVLKKFDKAFGGDNVFCGFTDDSFRFCWQPRPDEKSICFLSKVRVDGSFEYSLKMAENFVRHHLSDVSVNKPLSADYDGEDDNFNLRKHFHERVKPVVMGYAQSALLSAASGDGIDLSKLGAVRDNLNEKLRNLSEDINDWFNVSCRVEKVAPVAEEYELILKNFNEAAVHNSNKGVLEAQLGATEVAVKIENLKKGGK